MGDNERAIEEETSIKKLFLPTIRDTQKQVTRRKRNPDSPEIFLTTVILISP